MGISFCDANNKKLVLIVADYINYYCKAFPHLLKFSNGEFKKVYYGCRLSDNEKIESHDVKFDKKIGGRSDPLDGFVEEKNREMCLKVFEKYEKIEAKN